MTVHTHRHCPNGLGEIWLMRTFSGALQRLKAGRTEPHTTLPVSAEACIAIKCWLRMICLVRYQESRFTRTLVSFAPAISESIVEFDASSSGARLIWCKRISGTEVTRKVCAVNLTCLGFRSDPSFQNLSEFIGAVLAFLRHVTLGNAAHSIALRGDIVTALTWASTERPRRSIATNAIKIWTPLQTGTFRAPTTTTATSCCGEDQHLG